MTAARDMTVRCVECGAPIDVDEYALKRGAPVSHTSPGQCFSFLRARIDRLIEQRDATDRERDELRAERDHVLRKLESIAAAPDPSPVAGRDEKQAMNEAAENGLTGIRWLVRVQERRSEDVVVVAADREEAYRLALEVDRSGWEPTTYAEVMRQIDGPWLESIDWYDPHGPGGVIVGKCTLGNSFSAGDVELLRARLEALGLKPEEHWNGEGSGSVSFRCVGRRGTARLSKKQTAILCAPRPATAQPASDPPVATDRPAPRRCAKSASSSTTDREDATR
ncbi:MAG: hypothetical protein ACJ79R_20560 [Anaeromyxobacteraceae bacterium]